jgi:hypothetical protein
MTFKITFKLDMKLSGLGKLNPSLVLNFPII